MRSGMIRTVIAAAIVGGCAGGWSLTSVAQVESSPSALAPISSAAVSASTGSVSKASDEDLARRYRRVVRRRAVVVV